MSRSTIAGMPVRWVMLVLFVANIANAQEATTLPSSKYAAQLSAECDALVRVAVKKPFGVGWDPDSLVAKQDGHPRNIGTGRAATPAAGWVLLRAGRLLKRDDFVAAGYAVAHGLVAGQTSSGQVPSPLVFGAKAGSRLLDQPVPDRASTVASVALFLALFDDMKAAGDADAAKVGVYHGALIRAAHWLLKQQAATGTWPVGFPADAPPAKQTKLVRLDDVDYRDCTLALLLAGRTLDDKNLLKAADLALTDLTKMTQSQPKRWTNLWCRGYGVDGSFYFKGEEFPKTPDLLACRTALQTLLAGSILTGRQELELAAEEGAATVNLVRNANGSWERFVPAYVAENPAFDPAASQPTMRRIDEAPTLRLPPILDAIAKYKEVGRETFLTQIGGRYSPAQQAERALLGLTDEAVELDRELNAKEMLAVEGAPPDKLNEKIRRLDLLLSAASAH